MSKWIIHGTALLGLWGLCAILHHGHTLECGEAVADESNYNLAVNCVDPVVMSFASNLNYNITIPAASRNNAVSPQSITVSATLATPVNGDGAPSIANLGSLPDGYLQFYHVGPHIKIGGVQCSPTSHASLAVHGDGSDDANYNIALQEPAINTWQNTRQVDQTSDANPITLFGSGGTLGGNIADGSDADNAVNGEISFGGSGSGAAYRLFNSLKILGNSASSHNETLTYTFTPQ